MKTVTFSSTKNKIDLLIKLAKELGVETQVHYNNNELTDEDMALPGSNVSESAIETWLQKDDGEAYEIEEAIEIIKKKLSKPKKKL